MGHLFIQQFRPELKPVAAQSLWLAERVKIKLHVCRVMKYYIPLVSSVYIDFLLFITSSDVSANGVQQFLGMDTKLIKILLFIL